MRGFLGAIAGTLLFSNSYVPSFAVGTVVGLYLGQEYDLPNLAKNVERQVNSFELGLSLT